LTDAGAVADLEPFSACSPATLSLNLRLHIPVILLGGDSYWANFDYKYGATVMITTAGANK